MNEQELYNKIITIPRYSTLVRNSTNQFDIIDWYLPEPYNEHYEGKARTEDYFTSLIERPKFDYLMQQKKPFYISAHPSHIYIYDLKEYPIEYLFWRWEWLPETTEFGRTKLVLKNVAYLNPLFEGCIDILQQFN